MRVAICLSGEMRNRPECLLSLVAHVAEPFKTAGADVDLFAHTRKDPWWESVKTLDFRAACVEENRHRIVDDVISAANPREAGESVRGGRRSFLYQSYMQQFWSLQAVGEMKRRAERQDGAPYDWVVRSRPDVYMKEPLRVAELERGVLHLPSNDWWPAEDGDGSRLPTFCDKFAVGPSQAMDAYFDVFTYLRQFCARYKLQGEAYLGWRLRELCIRHRKLDTLQVYQADDPYKHSLRPDA